MGVDRAAIEKACSVERLARRLPEDGFERSADNLWVRDRDGLRAVLMAQPGGAHFDGPLQWAVAVLHTLGIGPEERLAVNEGPFRLPEDQGWTGEGDDHVKTEASFTARLSLGPERPWRGDWVFDHGRWVMGTGDLALLFEAALALDAAYQKAPGRRKKGKKPAPAPPGPGPTPPAPGPQPPSPLPGPPVEGHSPARIMAAATPSAAEPPAQPDGVYTVESEDSTAFHAYGDCPALVVATHPVSRHDDLFGAGWTVAADSLQRDLCGTCARRLQVVDESEGLLAWCESPMDRLEVYAGELRYSEAPTFWRGEQVTVVPLGDVERVEEKGPGFFSQEIRLVVDHTHGRIEVLFETEGDRTVMREALADAMEAFPAP